MIRCAISALLLAPFIGSGVVAAQDYPAKPVRIIIPFAPGGATDVVFRILTPPLSEHLGQSVIIDNRPGGAATIGMNLIAKAPADGYTIGVANVSLTVNPLGTPPAVINRLHTEIVKSLADPELQKRIAAVGARTVGGTPQELGTFIQKDLATWSTLVKATGIHID